MNPVRSTVLAFTLLVIFAFTAKAQLPPGWTDADIGTCTPAGSATYSSGAFTVNGSGTGFGATSDAFNYCYQSYTGNCTIIARVTSNNGYAALMVRESLAANARFVQLYTFPTVATFWTRVRSSTGGTALSYSGPTLSYPNWLKVVRAGDCIYLYYSTDDTHWEPMTPPEVLSGLSSTIYVGMAISHGSNGTLSTVGFDNVSVQATSSGSTVPGTVKDTWIGNTFANGTDYQQVQYNIVGMYVDSDGTCFANTVAEEAGRNWGIYKNGAVVGYLDNSGDAEVGGAAVTADNTYLYVAEAIDKYGPTGYTAGTVFYGVRRISKTSPYAAAPFSGGYDLVGDLFIVGSKYTAGAKSQVYTPGNVWGLACDSVGGNLYASDPLNSQIDVITTSNMTKSATWTLPSGCSAYGLCWDSAHSLLWAIVQNNNVLPITRQVWAFNTSGVQQTNLTITGAADPVSLATYATHLYIADNGPDQNIKVYSSINTAPTLWIYYGAVGGSFLGSGTSVGTTGDWRLNGLTSIGIDSTGNIYVACNGCGPDLNEDCTYHNLKFGQKLESYSLGTRALNWRLQGLEFFDVASIDPGDETSAFGISNHYSLNWNNTTPGSEWSAVGNTLNWMKYPNDTRMTNTNTQYPLTQVARIGGQKFLASGDNYYLTFYRFASSSQGETAIPCAEFICTTTDPGHSGLAFWTDDKGDGVRLLSQTTYAGTNINPMVGSYIDTNGSVWTSNGPTILQFRCSLNGIGAPQYSWTNRVVTAFSSLGGGDTFKQVNHIAYDVSSDTMYLFGFTNTHPNPGDGGAGFGTVVQCYTNWSSGTPVWSWESVLPIFDTGTNATSFCVESMASAGKYLFMQYQQGAQTLVLSKATGAQVGYIYPDPVIIGGVGWSDFTHSVSAFERSNGEYIITVEDDVYNKSIVYRWTGAP